MRSLRQKFYTGWVPDELDLSGKYRVYLVGPLMPKLRFLLHRKVFNRRPSDDANPDISGTNEFLRFLCVGKFRVERGPSLSDPDLDVVRIVYDDPRNPFFLRPLVDEVRQIGPGTFLGQGMYQVFGKAAWIFWFLVKK